MAQPSVSQLKEFQTKLNSSIDSYVAAIESNPEDPKATWKVDAEAQKLEGVVNVFAKSIRNPILHISEIGWQVSSEGPLKWIEIVIRLLAYRQYVSENRRRSRLVQHRG